MLYLFCFVLYLYNNIVICICIREAPCTGLEPFVLPFSLNKLMIMIINQILRKIKIAVRISSRKGH